ncbi:acyl-coenzyme A thioesterase 9, mitochondrial [Petromyzon marinus]|uniref:Acyl-coenzyme A thioesterase 9, mitochondrial n=1 Tax=Petromyzon marinus TaxID=7757 RepID=A0AAJ7XBE8_PETMA|nr:acyl-coenzyme A thioesterase 9, mitochondrial [Petromyzon marinus]
MAAISRIAVRRLGWYLQTQLPAAARREFSSSQAAGTGMIMTEVRQKLQEIIGVSDLWSDHGKVAMERKAQSELLPTSQDELEPRSMKDSYQEVLLPLGSEIRLHEKYLNFHKGVRFGRILEDLDTFSVLISYTHNKNPKSITSPLSIVTAMVDKIHLDPRTRVIRPDSDIKFCGHVSWAGSSSMEVKMQMMQVRDEGWSPVLDATFVLVARNPATNKRAFVHPLKPEGPEEMALFQKGEINKLRRVNTSNASLLKMAPTSEEREIVHKIFLGTLDTRTVSFQGRCLPDNSMWMENAKLKGLQICHPQERNIHNKIFGGFLMRKAFELAWANAYVFCGERVYVVAVDDILFQKPVEIGALLYLNSQVCYTEGNNIQVRVQSEVHVPQLKEHYTTNVFHFTFMADSAVPKVAPKSYGESMLYLDGKRHFQSPV